jgi:DNA-binding NtrC family response regulator
MRRAQVVVMERDGRLAEMLRPAAQVQGWWVREVRQPASCLDLLRQSGPTVLVLLVGPQVEIEMALLERVSFLAPECQSVVVIESSDGRLANLAWDLGAAYVLFSAQLQQHLADLVTGLMPGE